MTRQRTTQVVLIDGSTVTVPEPPWCLGEHENGLHLVDFFHDGPVKVLTVETRRGPVDILDACLAEYPYATDPARRLPIASVALNSGYTELDPNGLLALADGLQQHSVTLRALARELTELRNAATTQ